MSDNEKDFVFLRSRMSKILMSLSDILRNLKCESVLIYNVLNECERFNKVCAFENVNLCLN